ncbi:MAG: translation initiation factor IF-2, partial [Clostridiales bacterium]|nr:translation initiation factor IF-2 [Clostridiales bacterium]
MRLGRVHKKSDKGDDTAAAPAAAAAPAPAPAAEIAPEKQEKAPEAEKPAKKATKKTEDAAPAKKTTKTSEKAKTAKTEEAAEEKKPAAKRTKKAAEAEEVKEEAPAKEKPAKKTSSKAAKAAETSEETKEAKKAEKAEKPAKVEEKPEEVKEAPKAEETKPEETKPEAPAAEPAKTETPAPEESNIVRPQPRPRLSSAVVSLGDAPARGETIRSSTIITYTGRDRKSPARSGQGGYGNQGGNQGGFGGGRGPQRGGGYQGHGGGGFDKDKDEEPGQKNQFRRPARPKAESPIDEVKKSRTNYAEKSAFDKKHNDNSERRDGNGKNAFADKRHQNRNAQFTGRVSEDGEYDDYSYKKKKKKQFEESIAEQQTITEIKIPAFITVKEFAEGIGKKSSEIIMALMKLGVMATINQELDFDTACLVADSFGINAELLEEKNEEDILFDEGEGNPENLQPRPPVVVVMGHVDHGKTSLLDRIRSTNVIEGEAGGITQKIGAYTVRLKGRQITFLDTPGHEAFTTMRARGAQFTDIAILVVAADDGVMPQTIEAINHAKAANTEIIVAINKIDKPGANPDKVKQELTNYELICEEWGGSTIMVPISAKKGIGIDELLENVLLTADVMELKADPTGQAKGAVIEAQLDKNRGPVASVLVQRGTLRQGDTVVCGPILGNIRAMYDDKGAAIKKAGPSIPVEILGLPEVPQAGEILFAVADDKTARQLVEKRKIKQREEQL